MRVTVQGCSSVVTKPTAVSGDEPRRRWVGPKVNVEQGDVVAAPAALASGDKLAPVVLD